MQLGMQQTWHGMECDGMKGIHNVMSGMNWWKNLANNILFSFGCCYFFDTIAETCRIYERIHMPRVLTSLRKLLSPNNYSQICISISTFVHFFFECLMFPEGNIQHGRLNVRTNFLWSRYRRCSCESECLRPT